MFLTVLCLQFIVKVLSEAPPAPPQNIHVDRWLMTWTPATEAGGVTHTVQYSSFDSNVWTDVPSCVRTPASECDVASTQSGAEHGCVMLRVRAERRGLTSVPVEACSRHGGGCTPEVSLTARPGYLTVHLSRNHSLAREHADHAKHRVYYGREGEPLREFKEGVASVTIEGLQVGRRYCTQVRYLYFSDPVGLPSCPRCELIPESGKPSGQTWIILTVALFFLATLSVGIAYVLAFRCGSIKQFLRETRYHIPEDFLLEPFPDGHHLAAACEERYDVISCVSPREPAGARRPLLDPPPSAGDVAPSFLLPVLDSEPGGEDGPETSMGWR
ncbi:uncharacterized protein [Brachionichthys hirsutus]|uniref:uncharacterized protein n=1 Tax=Brachionichthys hirsutus TaxID=412623 RepID=UPI0036044890